MHRIPMNNNLLRKARGEASYQAVIVDLAKAGLIDKTKAETLLGYDIKDTWEDSQYAKREKKSTATKPASTPSTAAKPAATPKAAEVKAEE